MANRKEIDIRVRTAQDLCKIAEFLGYRDNGNYFPSGQLNNSAFSSSLLNLLDENPGLIDVMKEWILDNMDLEDEEDENE